MPTLPMHAHDTDAHAWQGIYAPGGYEWWRFHAVDTTHDRRIIMSFHDGDPFDSHYRRAYARYRRNPTRVEPPLPKDWYSARTTIYRGKHIEHRIIDLPQRPLNRVVATRDPTRFALHLSTMEIQPSGAIHLCLTLLDRPLEVHLRFNPPYRLSATYPPENERLYWFASPYQYTVTGNIGNDEFDGNGVWDHAWGTVPLGQELRRWMQGSTDVKLT